MITLPVPQRVDKLTPFKSRPYLLSLLSGLAVRKHHRQARSFMFLATYPRPATNTSSAVSETLTQTKSYGRPGLIQIPSPKRIFEKKVRELYKAIGWMLSLAVKVVSKQFDGDYWGKFREYLQVHNCKLKKRPTGKPIEIQTIGSRKTYFTSEQELFTSHYPFHFP